MPIEGEFDYEWLLKKEIKCDSDNCNNGCQLAEMAKANQHKLGGVVVKDTALPEQTPSIYADRRLLVLDCITMVDVDAEMIGEGELDIEGKRRYQGAQSYCWMTIGQKTNGSGENFHPIIDDFKKLPMHYRNV